MTTLSRKQIQNLHPSLLAHTWKPTGVAVTDHSCNLTDNANKAPTHHFGPHAGQRALHTCTSWYAYAAMFGSSYQLHRTNLGSLFIAWPSFVSCNLWLMYNKY